jgi:general secretion pathway protein C
MTFDRIAQRHFAVVLVCGGALSAFLSARGVVRIAEAAVAVDAKMIAASPLPSASESAQPENEKSARAILERNPFDSVTGPLRDLLSASPPGALPDPNSVPACDGVRILIIAQSADPDWSFAALTSGEPDAKSQLRRRGGEFAGKKVEVISWDRIWFSDRGSICQAALFSHHAPAPPKNAPSASGVDPLVARGIHRTSANQFEVDRGALDKILENQAELMKVRVVPERENGTPIGIRIFGVKEDSLFGMLGMENGDLIESLNGLALASPQEALEAYGRLRVADHLTARIQRKGKDMQIDYDIR